MKRLFTLLLSAALLLSVFPLCRVGAVAPAQVLDIIHYDDGAYLYNGTAELASVDEFGKVLAGKLTGKAARFVAEKLPQIAEGIRSLYYK